MATPTLTNDVANETPANDLAIKTENETYRVYVKVDADGKILDKETRVVTAGKDNATWNELDKPENGYHQAFEQTVRIYKIGSLEGLQQVITDPEEQVAIINRGLTQKFNQKLNAKFREVSDNGLELAFEPTAEATDTIEWLNEETQRRRLDPIGKAIKALQVAFPNMTADQLRAMISSMQQ